MRAEVGAVKDCGLASTVFNWVCFRQGYSMVGAPLDVHEWCARVRVPLPRLWAVSSVDRAPGYEPGGRMFESCTAHGEHGIAS